MLHPAILIAQEVNQKQLYQIAASEQFFLQHVQQVAVKKGSLEIQAGFKLKGSSSIENLSYFLNALADKGWVLGDNLKIRVHHETVDCSFIIYKLCPAP